MLQGSLQGTIVKPPILRALLIVRIAWTLSDFEPHHALDHPYGKIRRTRPLASLHNSRGKAWDLARRTYNYSSYPLGCGGDLILSDSTMDAAWDLTEMPFCAQKHVSRYLVSLETACAQPQPLYS